MMTAIWTIKGADFSVSPVGFAPPVTSGLRGWWYLGGNRALTERDLAFGADATLFGSPTISPGYVSFDGFSSGKWLQTSVRDTNSETLLVVARSGDTFASAARSPTMIGNYGIDAAQSGANVGSMIIVHTGAAPTANIAGSQHHNIASVITPDLTGQLSVAAFTGWKFLSKTFNDSTNIKRTRNLTDSTGTTTTNTNVRVLHSANTYRVGAAYTTSFGGECDVAFAAIYDVGLTDAEVDLTYEFVAKFLLDRRGLVI